MSEKPTQIDKTITLLKIQALLASTYELSREADRNHPRLDTRFLSYLIKMARMEVRARFDSAEPAQRSSENRGNLDRM